MYSLRALLRRVLFYAFAKSGQVGTVDRGKGEEEGESLRGLHESKSGCAGRRRHGGAPGELASFMCTKVERRFSLSLRVKLRSSACSLRITSLNRVETFFKAQRDDSSLIFDYFHFIETIVTMTVDRG